jgi:hypothetical protein
MTPAFLCLALAMPAAPKEKAVPGFHVEKTSETITVGNPLVSLTFSKRARGIFLTSLRSPARKVEFAAPPDEQEDAVWRLDFRSASGETASISSADGLVEFSTERPDQRTLELRLDWDDLTVESAGDTDVSVRIVWSADSPITHWSLSVSTEAEKMGLWKCAFPCLPNLSGEGVKLAVPFGWGLEYQEVLAAGERRGVYPGLANCMQFLCAGTAAGAIYLGAHDPQATYKEFASVPDEKRATLRCEIVDYPAGMGRPARSYRLPYQAAVGIVADWYDACRVYRAWSASAPYGKAGSIRERPIPRWLKDTDIWLLMSEVPDNAAERAKRFADFFGVPTAIHWYSWHQIPFDTKYPDYFPAREGFAKAVRSVQDLGIRVMPYINGRLWDPATDSWNDENAEASCAKNENLEPYTEVYGSGVKLAVMCPTTALWQRKITELVDRLIHQVGVDAVYIDQITAAAAVLCFDPNHPHAPGGGDLWARGYRELLGQVRKQLGAQNMITSEESTDTWNDQFDALLLVNTPQSDVPTIPMYPAVWSGRMITFGFQYGCAEDLDRSLPFRSKMARAFIYGAQLGWIDDTVLQDKYRLEAEYLQALARCRSRAHKFLSEGEMLAPPQLQGVKEVTVEGMPPWGPRTPYHLVIPAVLSSAWRAADGSIGIALTNLSDQNQSAKMDIPLASLGLYANAKYNLTRIGPEGAKPAGKFAGPRFRLTQPMPPRSALILEISP